LIDMHVHLDGSADIGGYRGLEFTDSFWGMTAVKQCERDMLDAGFTTVRNRGPADRNDIGLKQAIDAGYATGPRIVPAGYALGATGGHCDSTFLPPSLEKKDGKEEGIGDTPDELRYQVRPPAQIWRRGHQGVRDGRRFFAQHRTWATCRFPKASCARSPTRRTNGGYASRRTRMARRGHSRCSSLRGSTRSSMPAWSMMRVSSMAVEPASPARVVRDGHLQHGIYAGRGREERRTRR
jgi:hypothetical protein